MRPPSHGEPTVPDAEPWAFTAPRPASESAGGTEPPAWTPTLLDHDNADALVLRLLAEAVSLSRAASVGSCDEKEGDEAVIETLTRRRSSSASWGRSQECVVADKAVVATLTRHRSSSMSSTRSQGSVADKVCVGMAAPRSSSRSPIGSFDSHGELLVQDAASKAIPAPVPMALRAVWQLLDSGEQLQAINHQAETAQHKAETTLDQMETCLDDPKTNHVQSWTRGAESGEASVAVSADIGGRRPTLESAVESQGLPRGCEESEPCPRELPTDGTLALSDVCIEFAANSRRSSDDISLIGTLSAPKWANSQCSSLEMTRHHSRTSSGEHPMPMRSQTHRDVANGGDYLEANTASQDRAEVVVHPLTLTAEESARHQRVVPDLSTGVAPIVWPDDNELPTNRCPSISAEECRGPDVGTPEGNSGQASRMSRALTDDFDGGDVVCEPVKVSSSRREHKSGNGVRKHRKGKSWAHSFYKQVEKVKAVFPEAGEPLNMMWGSLVFGFVQSPLIMVYALMSAPSPLPYLIYERFMSLYDYGWIFLLVGGLLGFILYLCDWTNWKSKLIQCGSLLVVGVMLALGGTCYTREYPGMPLILVYISFIVYLTAWRYLTAGKLSARAFYLGVSLGCAVGSLWSLIAWLCWVLRSNMYTHEDTKMALHTQMANIFTLYSAAIYPFGYVVLDPGWVVCRGLREFDAKLKKSHATLISYIRRIMKESTDKTKPNFPIPLDAPLAEDELEDMVENTLAACSHLELTTFLIWATPFIMSVVCLIVATVTYVRFLASPPHADPESEDSADRTRSRSFSDLFTSPSVTHQRIKLLLWVLAAAAIALWVGIQQLGMSMGLSSLYIVTIFVSFLMLLIWSPLAFDLRSVATVIRETVMWKIALPYFTSDWFYGLLLAVALYPLAFFLLIEVFVRILQRARGIAGKHAWLTDRGCALCEFLGTKHWTSCFKKATVWCVLYFTLLVCEKFTSVFLGWLNGELGSLANFGVVCLVWYLVCLFLFMLPPVPGVPVYMSGGAIIAIQGKELMSRDWSIIFATFLTTLLKNNAVLLHQMVIGRLFGKSKTVLFMVGVHRKEIRAIEKILKKPWNSVRNVSDKIAMMVGGPDWPVSVLTGILKLPPVGIAVATSATAVLIAPCIVAGVCLVDDEMQSLSAVIITTVVLSQGGLLLWALVSIAAEVRRSHAELSIPRPEHHDLIEMSTWKEEERQEYLRRTRWETRSHTEHMLLVSSVVVGIYACGMITFRGPECFRSYQIGSDIDAPYSEGGLGGQVGNVIKIPEGVVAFSLFGASLALSIVCKFVEVCSFANVEE